MFYNFLFLEDVGFAIKQSLRTASGKLAALLYNFIVDMYEVFMALARAQILRNEIIQNIYNRVGLILGLFMVFKLAFSLLQSLIDPDKITDKKKGFKNIIMRSVISIILLGITPTLFREAFRLQDILVGTGETNNIIYKFIVANESNTYEKTSTFGRRLASDIFFDFYKESGNFPTNLIVSSDDTIKVELEDFSTLKRDVQDGVVDFSYTVDYLVVLDDYYEYAVDWDGLGAIVVALLMIYLLFIYCIQTASRVIQLAYLQLIAPVPILSYISDPDGSFKIWIQQCLTTFLDLFIRLAIIYFVVLLSGDVISQFSDAIDNSNNLLLASTGLQAGSRSFMWVKIFIILGLLFFAKRVPELLKELFPFLTKKSAASIGYGPLKVTDFLFGKTAQNVAKGAAILGTGVAAGAVAGSVAGLRYGEGLHKIPALFGGALRGALSSRTSGNIFKNAGNGINNVRAANERAYRRHHDDSTFVGRLMPGHAQRTVDRYDRENQVYTNFNSLVSNLNSALEKDSIVQAAMTNLDNLKKSNRFKMMTSAEQARQIKKAKDAIEDAKRRVVEREVLKERTTPGSGKAEVIAAINGLSRVMESNKKLEGFNGKTSFSINVKNSAGAYVTSEHDVYDLINTVAKSAKSASVNITQQGGTRNEVYERNKANASYGNRNGNQ